MKNLQSWFDKGMNHYEYIANMNKHKENLLHVYNRVTVTEEEKTFLHSLQQERLKAVILTADWCGDAMVNIPILLRLADEALIETRYLIRDDNLELMDQYLTNGKSRSIPIFIFLNEEGQEVGKWGPRAPQVQKIVDELKQKVPAKDEPGYEEAMKEMVKEVSNIFTSDEALWEVIKEDLIQTLRNTSQV